MEDRVCRACICVCSALSNDVSALGNNGSALVYDGSPLSNHGSALSNDVEMVRRSDFWRIGFAGLTYVHAVLSWVRTRDHTGAQTTIYPGRPAAE